MVKYKLEEFLEFFKQKTGRKLWMPSRLKIKDGELIVNGKGTIGEKEIFQEWKKEVDNQERERERERETRIYG